MSPSSCLAGPDSGSAAFWAGGQGDMPLSHQRFSGAWGGCTRGDVSSQSAGVAGVPLGLLSLYQLSFGKGNCGQGGGIRCHKVRGKPNDRCGVFILPALDPWQAGCPALPWKEQVRNGDSELTSLPVTFTISLGPEGSWLATASLCYHPTLGLSFSSCLVRSGLGAPDLGH